MEHPVEGTIAGLRFLVVRPTILALMKFYAWKDRHQDAKYAGELRAMARLGSFDADAVRDMLRAMGDAADLAAFDRLISPPPPPKGGKDSLGWLRSSRTWATPPPPGLFER